MTRKTHMSTGGLDPCPDCGVKAGEEHVDGCDVARCLDSGRQRLMCSATGGTPVVHEIDGETVVGRIADDHDCGRDVWTGRWPGDAECEEFGWYAHLEPGAGWVPCSKDTPGAVPDLNRLITQATWDATAHRWRINEGVRP